MHVLELWRYPVKSFGGERVPRARVSALGLEGDRRWGLRALDDGTVLTARREPRLLLASARLDDSGAPVLTLPDGAVTDGDAALSRWLGRPVALEAAGAEGGVYENPQDAERETGWVSWQGPGAAWHDSRRTRVSLISTAALGPWDARRFRSNVLLAAPGTSSDGRTAPEDALVGGTVRLGGAAFEVVKQVDRCVMVTRAQPGLPVDRDVLRAVHRERGGCLAVGALVTTDGAIAEGDMLFAG